MRNLKKIFIIFAILAFVMLLLIFASHLPVFFAQFQINRNSENLAKDYLNFQIEKNGYILKTVITENNNIDFLSFIIEKKQTDEIVFDSLEFKGRWRLVDFKEIRFDDDSLNVIVDSGDTGSTVYVYEQAGWKEKTEDGSLS